MWTLLILVLCSTLQSITSGDVRRRSSPSLILCKADEEYKQCGCMKTCCNEGKPLDCTGKAGCFCKDGLVRNKNGDCIPLQDCNKTTDKPPSPPECGRNEIYYDDCAPSCTGTCEAFLNKGIYNCPLCRPGCWCKKGFVKNKDGNCVPTSQCGNTTDKPPSPTSCGKDEVYYDECAPSCTGTCERALSKGIYHCPLCRPGCWCKKGFVKNNSGKCVPISNCGNTTAECGEDEEYKKCGTACPTTCENLYNPQPCTDECVKGCFCKEGLIRDKDNNCVEPDDCPRGKPPQCKKDEEYYERCAPSCTGRCEAYNSKRVYHCPICRPGCWCKKGLYKNSEDKCVPPSKCGPPTGQCGTNEVFKACGTSCPLTCSNLWGSAVCKERCVTGCFCKDGFVKNDKGECVDPEECPPKECGENEKYNNCGSACPKTCKNKDKTIFCTLQCVPGCFCANGFVRDSEGKCIDPKQCEPNTCPPDEQYYEHVPSCKNTCEHYNNPGIRCAAGPPGCFCKEGLVKRKDGKCVNPRECEGNCPPDEQYYENVPSCKNTCKNYNNPGVRCPAGPPGCFCKEGLVKREDGKCVNPRECHDQCGVDEVYQECGTACPRTCQSLYTKIRCIEKCTPGCFCRDDLVRHNGKCIHITECQTQQCGENEVYKKCGSSCPLMCPSVPRSQVCSDQCISGCFCEDGFVRNGEGVCVKPSDCPSKQCGADEEYMICGTACPLTCSNLGKPVHCTKQCVKGCFCKHGLVRNDDGKCVDSSQCPKTGTCGKNEEYQACGTFCPRTCKNLPYQMRCIAKCVEGCFCKEGFVRNDDNECVDPQECPSEECGENEVFSNCGSACPETCANTGRPRTCTLQCKIGCICKKGYVKNDEGKCILPEQCPKVCNGYNEELVDCAKPKSCNTCEIRGNCKLKKCDKGCDCKPGYYRNASEICIPESECPNPNGPPNTSDCNKEPESGPCFALFPRFYYDHESGTCKSFTYGGCLGNKNNFETESECIKQCGGSSNSSDCDKGPETGPCKAAMPRFYYDKRSGTCKSFIYGGCKGNKNNFETESDCYSRCGGSPNQSVCDQPKAVGNCRGSKPRFYYDRDSGRCQRFYYSGCGGNQNNFKSAEECSKKCRRENKCAADEEYKTCGTACPATCANRGKPVHCTRQCVKGCFCKEGLVRNDNGKCVEPDKCPEERCRMNEEYEECGTGCPKTCRNLNIQISCIDKCFKGCFCKKGLVRNDDGDCVEPSECPSEKCGENEEYSNCGSACPETCANTGKPRTCTLQCKIGCICKKGYVKNDEGKCILPEQCPKEECNGTNEALVDCAKPKWCNTCGIRGNCKLAKCEKGCDCKPDYYRNDKGICIPKEQCPRPCPENEEYSNCANPCNDCEIRGKCNFLVCNEGCECIKGYYRDTNNKCIPEEKCPLKHQCDEDEVYKKCGTACPKTCSNLNIKIKCISTCVEGCFCKDGLVRNGDKKCVEPSECPNEECNGYNEALVDCAKPKWCNTCDIKGNCKLKDCEKGCDCKPDYYRNATGICIPEAECSSCPLNEEYSNCVNPCNTCEIRGKCNFLVCNKGCDCKRGYHRDGNKKCIPAKQCPMKNPTRCRNDDEEFYNCTPFCKNTCENYNKPNVPCPKICKRGCFCKKGLVKRSDGKCVSPSECEVTTKPPTQTCKSGEEYYNCVPTCRNTCETYNNTHMACPLYCRSGCACKKGLVLRKDSKCVRPEKCNTPTKPPTQNCKSGEEYYNCVPTCRNTCENYNNTHMPCPLICRSGCACKKGLVLRKDNKCVRPEKCNRPTKPPTQNCGPGKEYYNCVPTCRNTCETYNNTHMACPLYCRSGCACKKGLVLRKDNKCVRPEKCNTPTKPPTQSCGPREQYYDCAPDCKNTCKNYNKEDVICPAICRIGCFCKEGLVLREEDNKCVRPSKCNNKPTKKCGKNEEYSTCGSACVVTCDNKDENINCTQECRTGCFCKKGYVRNSKEKCVLPEECPSGNETCGKREQYYDCIPSCYNSCETYNRTDIACRQPCRSGCFCKEGLVLRKDKKCVPPAKCNITTKPPTCGPHEKYYDCVPKCRNTCESYNKKKIACATRCYPGCFCKEGYVLRKDKKCVRPDECNSKPTEPPKQTCGKREQYYDCIPKCYNTCETYNRTDIGCAQSCYSGCFCKEGLVLRNDNKCVRPEKCNTPPTKSPGKTCGPKEQYYECIPSCRNTCKTYNTKTFCALICRSGCFCKEGLVLREEDNECVRPSKCNNTPTEPPPQTCRADEQYYDCIPNCLNTCKNHDKDDVICPEICISGCFCKEGLVLREKDNKCVRPRKCNNNTTEPPPVCGEDEEYYEDCAPSCTGSCDTYGKEAVILCQVCKPGCWCKKGLVKNNHGKCIPPSKCKKPTEPPQICGKDEIYYSDCAPKCHGTCETYNRHNILCVRCEPGCWCKKGLVKRKDGKCVSPKKCDKPAEPTSTPTKPPPSCPKDQQYYPCKPTCKRTCMTFNSTGTFCPKVCIAGCFCKEGLVMDKSGECMKPEQCPRSCNFTEEYYDCKPDCQNVCNPPEVCDKACRPGCFCRKDLVLREDGLCVRKEVCGDVDQPPEEQCGPDKEYYTCYSQCRNKCSSYEKPVACPALCERGCFCKKGMLINDDGQCVAPEECKGEITSEETETVDEEEEEEEVEEEEEDEEKVEVRITRQVYGGRNQETYGERNQETYGGRDQETYGGGEQWSGGSRRQTQRNRRPFDIGGTRFDFGGRINPKECGPNEEWSDCGSSCPVTCENFGKPQMCTLECAVGCFCKEGFVRNKRGVCIPPGKCKQNRRRIDARRGYGARSSDEVFSQTKLEDLRVEPSGVIVEEIYYSDGTVSEELSGSEETNEYSETLQGRNSHFEDNAGGEEQTWSESETGRFTEQRYQSESETGRLEEQSYRTGYSEETNDDSEDSDENIEWEIVSA